MISTYCSELVFSGIILSNKQSAICENTPKVDSSQTVCNGKKAQRLPKKNKLNQVKIIKTNLNKAIDKCYSPAKTTATIKKNNAATTGDNLFVLKDSSNLRKKKQSIEEAKKEEKKAECKKDLKLDFSSPNLDHFVEDCKEFDCVLEKIKFKEQFKLEYEAQLNRGSKKKIQPLFNTLSVFEPISKEDDVDDYQSEISIYNSPLIAEPTSIALASKVDMNCLQFDFQSNDEIENYEMNCLDLTSPISELSSPLSELSSNQSIHYDLLEATSSSSLTDHQLMITNANYIPQIDELKTTIGNTNSIFTPLIDNSDSFMLACDDEDKLSVDYDYLAPAAGDSCMSLGVSLDFDELPPNLDLETEKLIKEISSTTALNTQVQNANSTILHKNELDKKLIDYNSNYRPTSRSLKIPNHFLSLDNTKKARISFNSSTSKSINVKKSRKFSCFLLKIYLK